MGNIELAFTNAIEISMILTLFFTVSCTLLLLKKIEFSIFINAVFLMLVGSIASFYFFPTSNESIIGRLFPFSDAAGYYVGSNRIFHGFYLDTWSLRRPMYSIFLAGLEFITNGRFLVVILIQILMNLISLFVAGFFVSKYFGKAAGGVFLVITSIFYFRFSWMILTENLGLQLGLWSVIFLLHYLRTQSQLHFFTSLLCISMALNVRAGSFFILPGLAFAFCLPITTFRDFSLKSFYCVLAITVPFVLTKFSIAFFGQEEIIPMSNFGHTLFGLVSGGKGWMYIYNAHPEIKLLSDSEVGGKIFNLAWIFFQDHPLETLKGVIIAYKDFLLPSTISIFGFLSIGWGKYSTLAILFLCLPLTIIFLFSSTRLMLRFKSNQESFILWGALLGIIISIPFVFPADADQMRAQAAIVPYLSLITVSSFPRGIQQVTFIKLSKFILFFPIVYGLVLIIALFRFVSIPANIVYSGQFFFPTSSLELISTEDIERKFKHAYPQIRNAIKKLPLNRTKYLNMPFDTFHKSFRWLITDFPVQAGSYLELTCQDSNYGAPEVSFALKECIKVDIP